MMKNLLQYEGTFNWQILFLNNWLLGLSPAWKESQWLLFCLLIKIRNCYFNIWLVFGIHPLPVLKAGGLHEV